MAKPNPEQLKAESQGLRSTLAAELETSASHFTSAAEKILKFHGVYQQEDRDLRKQDRAGDHHQFMIRTKLPGGQLTAEQYLTHDRLASDYANGTLRITTRQDFQLHGVLKGDLRSSLQAFNEVLVTTLGACGDIVRNVMACPAPTSDPQRLAVQNFAFQLTRALYPRTSAYHQIWLDGEEMINDQVVEDPLYGTTYLPRKFKIAIAYAGDNCVDVYTNDVGLVALFDEANTLTGFNLLAGGGMGMTHNNDATYARLADEIGFITRDQVVEVVKAIVTIHRDFGDRADRKHARLKYILHERGVDWFRAELESRVGFRLGAVQPMPEFEVHDHLGWQEQGENRWFLGIPVENGRIVDRGQYRLRSGLRAVIERFQLSTRLTAQQNILLTGIAATDRSAVTALLADYGVRTVEQISAVRRNALACPALPTCGLAITEAERVFPGVIDEVEATLEELGLGDADITLRMTGCPNGCARPYVAEVAFVGRSLDKYAVFLGGSPVGTRLAKPFLDLVHLRDLVPTLRPVLAYYRDTRRVGEAFGEFCLRVGFDHLRELIAEPIDEPVSGD
ncbi:MAG TPA: NADPH-dependent assimilatory sulfite reductase hemoprotein subunit [Phototrophicaceae bacterium]|nr:NADPH-dependent assimilatory sulfite reductase hemoprotein subunit [Phototrophicaceae bacterium]